MERVHLSKRVRRRTLAYFLVIHSIACPDNTSARRQRYFMVSHLLGLSRALPFSTDISACVCIYVKVIRPRVRQRYFSIGDAVTRYAGFTLLLRCSLSQT